MEKDYVNVKSDNSSVECPMKVNLAYPASNDDKKIETTRGTSRTHQSEMPEQLLRNRNARHADGWGIGDGHLEQDGQQLESIFIPMGIWPHCIYSIVLSMRVG